MSSCLVLERPGAWRWAGVVILLGAAVIPTCPLLADAFFATSEASFDGAFPRAMVNSLTVAGVVALGALAVGLPLGVFSALYRFPGRSLVLPILIVPLLVPTFLWAIGWSSLTAKFGPTFTWVLSGRLGCVLVFVSSAIPLVLLVSHAAASSLSGSQVDATRLAGGQRAAVWYTCRYVATPAALAAALAAAMTLSDPGPGQVLGMRAAASEILTSFSLDLGLAALQSFALGALALVLAIPLVVFGAPRLAQQVLVRQMRTVVRPTLGLWGRLLTAGFALLIGVVVVLPSLGLVLPLFHGLDLARSGREIARTGGDTLWYAIGSGFAATLAGFTLAGVCGRDKRLQMTVLAVSLGAFALPPSLSALGIVRLAGAAPPWLDFLFRSRLTVCFDLGARFLPIATVIGLRAWGTTSSSATYAAALHGIPLRSYLARVLGPQLLPALATSVLLVALLATADISTVLLLHPPGHGSFPLAIFTVMANAPESLVASLCLMYLAAAGGVLAVLLFFTRRTRA